MNKTDSKCQNLTRYKTLAEAQAIANRILARRGTHQAYGCECGGFHVVRVGPTRAEKQRDEREALYGDLARIIHRMIGLEMRNYVGRPKRRLRRNSDL